MGRGAADAEAEVEHTEAQSGGECRVCSGRHSHGALMMIDPLVSLAFAMHSSPGAYALLLGSGISRPAGIPTGWDLVLDLIHKIATMEGQDPGPDPAAWYASRYGHEPDYSRLLEQLARTPAERRQLLAGYFEPTDEEREQGLKVPTAAHHAIAELMARGNVRVVITTNFDRLLEQALEARGVSPVVLSTPDSIEGAPPLAHLANCVVKVHGDYLDTRIKNTEGELSDYDGRVNQLLDGVFDAFGLVVCGWSAEWDPALANAIERCKTHRFTTFWTSRGDMSERASHLSEVRRAQHVVIDDANSFFTGVVDRIIALDDIGSGHPLSPAIAVATMKRFLAEERYRIRLHDLVAEHSDRAWNAAFSPGLPVEAGTLVDVDEFDRRLRFYESAVETLMTMAATGCYWGGPGHGDDWVSVLTRIGSPPNMGDGVVALLHFQLYPALLVLYACGIGALAAGNWPMLTRILKDPVHQSLYGSEPLVRNIAPASVVSHELMNGVFIKAGQLAPNNKRHTPSSDHLFDIVRNSVKDALPVDDDYAEAFDLFEYLFGLAYLSLTDDGRWGPIGRFAWRARGREQSSPMKRVEDQISEMGTEWPLLVHGLFGGSLEKLKQVKAGYDELVQGRHW